MKIIVNENNYELLMMNYKKYPKYKNSGIEWLGEIPEEWKQTIAKRIWEKESRPVRDKDEIITAFRDGTVTLRKNKKPHGYTIALKEIGYQGIRKKDLVIHQMDAFAGAIGVSDSEGKSTPVYSVCTPIFDADPYYYNYLLREMSRSKYILSLAKGIRERSTDFRFKMFGDLNIPLPTSKEQTTIANFLDYKLEKIDRFISKKKQLIKLLKEQKAAVINQAVTKGLDKNATMKDSGIEWLGDIPDSWEIKKLKYVANCFPSNIDKHSKENEETVRLCNYTDVYKNDFITNEMDLMVATAKKDQIKKFTLLKNDVIITKDSETADDIANPALVIENLENIVCGYHLSIMRPYENLDGGYLFRALQCKPINVQFELCSLGVTRVGLGVYDMKSAKIPVPPISEQKEIFNFIQTETTKIEKTITTIQKEITLVAEYKTALIAEAVTGKIDVREFEVPQVEIPLAMAAEEAVNYSKKN